MDKPESVAADPFKSAKWDELTAGRRFGPSDAPALALLVQWHAVLDRCVSDMDEAGGSVVYQTEFGDIRALPHIGIMKQASAEIRQLNKQLGIADGGDGREAAPHGENVLELVQGRRLDRARAAGA